MKRLILESIYLNQHFDFFLLFDFFCGSMNRFKNKMRIEWTYRFFALWRNKLISDTSCTDLTHHKWPVFIEYILQWDWWFCLTSKVCHSFGSKFYLNNLIYYNNRRHCKVPCHALKLINRFCLYQAVRIDLKKSRHVFTIHHGSWDIALEWKTLAVDKGNVIIAAECSQCYFSIEIFIGVTNSEF